MGIETEFGVTCTFHGNRRLSLDEVGSHREYTTVECDSLVQLVTPDRASEWVLEDLLVAAAVDQPPQTTRASLCREFISAAQEAGRDFTVDWVPLKLEDQVQGTVLCKDPFRAVDERVKRPIVSM